MAKGATVSIYDAKTRLSHLVDRALQGDEVIITRHGRPVARDFDAPLPDGVLGLFEGRSR